jgi:carbon-monoxide dehydrogenase medium subunit
MKPAPFAYQSVPSAKDARALLSSPDAKVIAGGQSLGPMLNLRLARPALLVDIARTRDLRGVLEDADAVTYGAAVTHADIEDGRVPDATPGWMQNAARHIAYRAVRNRGTIGGSLAHADPAADWVNIMTALGASVLVAGPQGDRCVPMEQFMLGPYATALADGELVAGVRVLRRGAKAQWGYAKFCRKEGDFAQASAAILNDPERGELRIVLGAIERAPVCIGDPDAFLSGRRSADEVVSQCLPERNSASRALHAAMLEQARAMALGGAVK